MPPATRTPPESQPRQVPPEQALPAPEIGASAAIGAGLAVGALATLAGTAAGVAAVSPVLPILKVGQETVEKLVEALRQFFVLSRARQERYLVTRFRGRLPQQDILDVIAEESGREAEFERRVLARVRRDGTKALYLPEEKRAERMKALVRRERRYARQRSEAMAVRALAALDRAALRIESPAGAEWHLDPNVKAHTPGCVIMAGHVLPWEIIDTYYPPLHAGCACSLRAPTPGKRVMTVTAARLLVARARTAEEAHGH